MCPRHFEGFAFELTFGLGTGASTWHPITRYLPSCCGGTAPVTLSNDTVNHTSMNTKFNLVVVVFVFTAVSFISYYLTRNGYLAIALHWMKELGWQGVIVLLLLFVVLSFPLPMGSTPLLLAAGFLYGFKLGLAAVTLGTFIGGNLAFFVCRKLLKKCKFVLRQNERSLRLWVYARVRVCVRMCVGV